MSKTKQEIDRMLKKGVIRIVNEPTDWCAPMVVLPKQNGQMRICVDFTKLIANIKWEVHQLPSVEFTLGKLENSKVFSKLDTNSAFWQCKLSEESKLLTTFITPLGEILFWTFTLWYIDRLRTVPESYDGEVRRIRRGRMPNWGYSCSWWESGPTWSATAYSLKVFVWFKHHNEFRKVWIQQNNC